MYVHRTDTTYRYLRCSLLLEISEMSRDIHLNVTEDIYMWGTLLPSTPLATCSLVDRRKTRLCYIHKFAIYITAYPGDAGQTESQQLKSYYVLWLHVSSGILTPSTMRNGDDTPVPTPRTPVPAMLNLFRHLFKKWNLGKFKYQYLPTTTHNNTPPLWSYWRYASHAHLAR